MENDLKKPFKKMREKDSFLKKDRSLSLVICPVNAADNLMYVERIYL